MKNSLNNSNKIVILKGNNEQLIKTIVENKNSKKFSLKRKISKKIFYILITNTDVNQIMISEAVYKQISKKNVKAIENLGIEIKKIKKRRGRPLKYNKKEIFKIKKFKTAKKRYGISKTCFYKIKNEFKK